MVTFLTIVYIAVALVMVFAILLQSGKGGGLGAALGGGASQSVFGGGGAVDFMTRLTQFCAGAFMVLAMYLAYASAHSGSSFLQENSQEDELTKNQVSGKGEVNYERVGPNPQQLPTAAEGKAKQLAATGQGETLIKSPVNGAPVPTTPEEAPAAIEDAPAATGEAVPAPTGEAVPAPTGEAVPVEDAPAEAAPAQAEAAPTPAEAAPTPAEAVPAPAEPVPAPAPAEPVPAPTGN